MSAITPQTNLRLLHVTYANTRDHIFDFDNVTAQTNYFKGLSYYQSTEYDNFTYQRASSVIRFPANIDSIQVYNYVMYNNDNYYDKWIYAYITKMEYVNDSMTNIYIETDVLQTWMFAYNLRHVFVEREHVDNDSIGKHTLPENLECGEFISTRLQPTSPTTWVECYVLATTEMLPGVSTYTITNPGKSPFALYYYGFDTLNDLRSVIEDLDNTEIVNSVFTAYKPNFLNWSNTFGSYTITGNASYNCSPNISETLTITRPSYIGRNYEPKNNKLFTYPFSYLQVSNHSGQIMNYRYEDFGMLGLGGEFRFDVDFTITPGGSGICYPIDYRNMGTSLDDCITLGKIPVGSWINDVYTNWLTQNCYNTALNYTQAAYQMVSGVASFSMDKAASGIFSVAKQIAQKNTMALAPDTAGGNTNCGDVNFEHGLNKLQFKNMGLKDEYAKMIDYYFQMYGYQVNEVKTPNTKSRTLWNYIKTQNAAPVANQNIRIPNEDLIKIGKLYDNGITFWHGETPNTSHYMYYSNTNSIVS